MRRVCVGVRLGSDSNGRCGDRHGSRVTDARTHGGTGADRCGGHLDRAPYSLG